MMETGTGIDWAMAEALAMGCVLNDSLHHVIFRAGTECHEVNILNLVYMMSNFFWWISTFIYRSLLLHADPSRGQTPVKNPHFPVRLSGQDCERGTFNQRHSVLYDQSTAKRSAPFPVLYCWVNYYVLECLVSKLMPHGNRWRGWRQVSCWLVFRYIPLNNICPGRQAEFVVCNSNLSEAAILGFEYGFSLENENALVLWEAQVCMTSYHLWL